MDSSLLYQSIRLAAMASFSRSGGPGGQNVNKVSTKVTLRIHLADLAGLNEAELSRIRELLANRITTDDEIVISSSEERSRLANLRRAFSRLDGLIGAAARIPKHRRPTKPGKGAREQRLRAKKLQGRKKMERRQGAEE